MIMILLAEHEQTQKRDKMNGGLDGELTRQCALLLPGVDDEMTCQCGSALTHYTVYENLLLEYEMAKERRRRSARTDVWE